MLIKRVSCVCRLIDSAYNRPLLQSQASISIDGTPAKPVYKPGGYFVLVDLPEGSHRIRIASFQYQPDQFDVTVDYSHPFNEKLDVRTVMLNPSANHPASRTGVAIRGRFADGVRTVFYIARSGSQLKIAQDGVEAGMQTMKLFAPSTVMLPSLFHIKDKIEKNGEFVLLKQADGDVYTMDMPLRFAHKRSSALVPMVKYSSADDGSFFAVLPAGYKPDASGTIALTLLAEREGNLREIPLTLTGKGQNDVGSLA